VALGARQGVLVLLPRPIDSSWSEPGARIIEFSPLRDAHVPGSGFLYIGGGYPELYRNELEANVSMRKSVRRFIESGKKISTRNAEA